jgi:hypothetical protein
MTSSGIVRTDKVKSDFLFIARFYLDKIDQWLQNSSALMRNVFWVKG